MGELIRSSIRRQADFLVFHAAQVQKIADQLGAMAGIYEQRMAYLIDSYADDGRLYEQEVEHWAGDRAFAIVHDEDGAGRFWKVVFQEEETADVPEKIEEQVQE